MFFEQIEKLKSSWTDKYVMVNRSLPELARFGDAVGTVRTVNMSGRCLVEFDQDNNIGWYDIDPTYLEQVDKPPPKSKEKAAKPVKPAAQAAAAKPSTKSKSTADVLAAARAGASTKPPTSKPPEQKAASAGAMSTADILAAARGVKAPASAAKEPATKETPVAAPSVDRSKMSVQDILAAARAEKASGGTGAADPVEKKQPTSSKDAPAKSASKPAQPVDRSKMTVADILAAARAEKQGEASPAAESPATEVAPTATSSDASTVEAEEVTEPAVKTEEVSAAERPPVGDLPTTTADIIAWCRARDRS